LTPCAKISLKKGKKQQQNVSLKFWKQCHCRHGQPWQWKQNFEHFNKTTAHNNKLTIKSHSTYLYLYTCVLLLLSLKKQQQNIDQMLRSGVERQRRHGFS
jgi:hypothetical protein